jgi:O-antigen/teichoic acid export membrane protein
MMMYVAIISFAAVFTLYAIAEPLIVLLIGEKWLPSVTLLRIMCFYAAIYPLNMLNLNVLNLRKRSDYLLKLEVIKKILFVPVIGVGFFFRIEAMLWAAVVYYYIEFFINGWYSYQLIGYGTKAQVRDMAGIYIISFSVALVAFSLTYTSLAMWMVLPLQLLVIVSLLVVIYRLLKQPEYMEIEMFCISKIRKR